MSNVYVVQCRLQCDSWRTAGNTKKWSFYTASALQIPYFGISPSHVACSVTLSKFVWKNVGLGGSGLVEPRLQLYIFQIMMVKSGIGQGLLSLVGVGFETGATDALPKLWISAASDRWSYRGGGGVYWYLNCPPTLFFFLTWQPYSRSLIHCTRYQPIFF